MSFHIATDHQIRAGDTTDVYFRRTREILEARGSNPDVRAEFVAKDLPRDWEWAVLAGLDEVRSLLGDLPVEVRSMPEGSLFRELEPVLEIRGGYRDFAVFETALLGFLCQASGVATSAARCRLAAGDRVLLAFGARRMHPASTPALERAAYVGGCDGVSTVTGASAIGIEPSGTIPHALILVIGDTVEATRAFDEVAADEVPRVSLIDTFHDEKFEAIRIAEELGDAVGTLRLDTPGSRKGDFYRIFEEVRWELDRRGFEDVGLFASGGLDEDWIRELNPLVDGYGVGGAITAAPVVDFALDIVEIEGEAVAKRGKWSGAKDVRACTTCGARRIVPLEYGEAGTCSECGAAAESLLTERSMDGTAAGESEEPEEVRARVLEGLRDLSGEEGE